MNKFRVEYQVVPVSALHEAENQFDELMQEFDFNNPGSEGPRREHEISLRLKKSMASCAVLLGANGRGIDVQAFTSTSFGGDGVDELTEAVFRGIFGACVPTAKVEKEMLLGVETVTYGIALSIKPDIEFFTPGAPLDSVAVSTNFSDIEELRLRRR